MAKPVAVFGAGLSLARTFPRLYPIKILPGDCSFQPRQTTDASATTVSRASLCSVGPVDSSGFRNGCGHPLSAVHTAVCVACHCWECEIAYPNVDLPHNGNIN